ncbi:MAG: hypothetical protein FLDDKLPJ_03347 [Phycisphaerae bacterium]|nr:hypothetical protein [Phycisphaerae bacterium]
MNESTKQIRNQPVHEFRIGAIKAVVWANSTTNGIVHNVVPVRLYWDDKGEWQETHSLGRDDLLVAAKVLDTVHTWIVETEQRTSRRSSQAASCTSDALGYRA